MSREATTSLAEANQTIEKIIKSGVLGNSERRSSLLLYLIEKELSGAGNEIKAFSIAMDVLGRDASFDPNTDSIVRSEIGRLRDALRLYYAEYAKPADVRIEIPKGTYRPVFRAPELSPPDRPSSQYRWPVLLLSISAVLFASVFFAAQFLFTDTQTGPVDLAAEDAGLPYEVIRIAVPIFEVHGNNSDAQRIAIGLNAELMMDLSAYPWLSIIAPVTGFDGIDPGEVDYVLDGEIFWGNQTLEIQVKLVTYPGEKLVWSDSQTSELDATALRDAIVHVASSIADNLASARGIAPELAKYKNANIPPENLDAYLCYLGVHQYLAMPTDQHHLELRTCLLQAIADFPEFGDAWAGLALVYIDEARFRTNARAGADPWEDARMAVQNALKYAPLRMPSLNVALISSIEGPEPDEVEFDRISRLLLNLFPKHPTTLYNVGSREAEFLGRWDEGTALVDEAISLSPDPPSAFFLTRAYEGAMSGTDAEVLALVAPLVSTTAVSQLLLNYLAAQRNDLPRKAEYYKVLLKSAGLDGHGKLMAHVKGRRYERRLEMTLLNQLEQANLKSGRE